MAERDLLLAALAAEVLGPRAGVTETLGSREDPLDEYITGVLAPHRASSIELDATDDLVGDDESLADDQSDPGSGVQPTPIDFDALPSPTLDPRSRPASLGISFSLEGAPPAVDICCTWARYSQVAGGGWSRQPFGEIWHNVVCSADCPLTSSHDPGIRVHLRSRHDGNRWRVSVFLVNSTGCGDRPGTEDHVFQPQIRIKCRDGTRLVPIDVDRSHRNDDEERSLSLLYRERRSLARGHLCSATWRDIDPERPHPTLQVPALPPFSWLDGNTLFAPAVRAPFSPADVRTEYLPLVPVNAPDKTWPVSLATPQLDPAVLAETWDPHALRRALEPLAAGYESWMLDADRQATAALAAGTLTVDERQTAARHLAACKRALERIRAGVDLLARDDDARLAFCFANHAIAMQSRWTKKGKINPWWPFQLAFQLINLPALANRAHPDRKLCDLLWFPTGGGKTEAYLGLAAFTMAHRRLTALRTGRSDGGQGVAVLSRYTLRLLTIQQFRRALAVITACERLRIDRVAGVTGWRPKACSDRTDHIWGTSRFSLRRHDSVGRLECLIP